jgi:hypothetical protein
MKLDKPTTLSLKDSDLLRTANYINGEWIAADDGAVMEVRNPSGGALVGTVRRWESPKPEERSQRPRRHFRSGARWLPGKQSWQMCPPMP